MVLTSDSSRWISVDSSLMSLSHSEYIHQTQQKIISWENLNKSLLMQKLYISNDVYSLEEGENGDI